jgi:hypothetical protein
VEWHGGILDNRRKDIVTRSILETTFVSADITEIDRSNKNRRSCPRRLVIQNTLDQAA